MEANAKDKAGEAKAAAATDGEALLTKEALQAPGSRPGLVQPDADTSVNRDYNLHVLDPTVHPQEPSDATHPTPCQCLLCSKRFTRAYNLRSHMRTHTDDRPSVCSTCGETFARQQDLKRHENEHHGREEV